MDDVIPEFTENMRIGTYEHVEMLRSAIRDAEFGDQSTPAWLNIILKRWEWTDRLDPHTNQPLKVGPKDFRRFITAEPYLGLGQDFDQMRARFCKTPELIDLWNRAAVPGRGSEGVSNNPTGKNQHSTKEHDEPEATDGTEEELDREDNDSNRIIKQKTSHKRRNHQGTTVPYALRRLLAQRPDLHARVLSNELSPNAAMVEAGFRKPTIQVPLDPDRLADFLLRKFTPEQLDQLIRRIADGRG